MAMLIICPRKPPPPPLPSPLDDFEHRSNSCCHPRVSHKDKVGEPAAAAAAGEVEGVVEAAARIIIVVVAARL